MMITTKQEFARALERLRRRDPESLAAFIVSLAQDTGPIGEQVRTFIVGDDIAETVESLKERIAELRTPTERDYRGRRGEEIGRRLEFILDAIETLVLPADPKGAFELLVTVFKADTVTRCESFPPPAVRTVNVSRCVCKISGSRRKWNFASRSSG
jgi:hypothetical protein